MDGKFEHLIDEDKLQITHIQIKKGDEVSSHKSDKNVIVVIYNGKVNFTGENGSEIIVPGDIINMQPNELHALSAIEDSDLMVIKASI